MSEGGQFLLSLDTTWGYVSPALIGPSDTDPSSRCEVERAGTRAWMARPSVRY